MRLVQLIVLLVLSGHANAEEWRYQVVPYIWWPNFQAGSTGDSTEPPSEGNLSFETETQLEAAFLVYTSAAKDRHLFSFEFDWVDVNTSAEASFPLFPDAEIDWELFAYTVSYGYKVVEGRTEADGLTVGLGARYFDLDIDTTLFGTVIPELTVNVADTWTDGFIELRGRQTFGDSGKWYVSGMLLVGEGGSDKMLDYGASLGYRWTEGFSTSVGYRDLQVDIDDFELTQDGAIIAFGWTF